MSNEQEAATQVVQRTAERGWMQTFTGRQFYPLNPDPNHIDIRDIAHGLAMTCRYAGHTSVFYSVAEHCVLVADTVFKSCQDLNLPYEMMVEYYRHALLHDSAEAYIGDMIRPLKHQPEMIAFRETERKIEAAVWCRFGLSTDRAIHDFVKSVDERILIDEILRLKANPKLYFEAANIPEHVKPLGITIHGWSPIEAEHTYLTRARLLGLV